MQLFYVIVDTASRVRNAVGMSDYGISTANSSVDAQLSRCTRFRVSETRARVTWVLADDVRASNCFAFEGFDRWLRKLLS
jgi:hypothetical protein